MAWGGVGPLAWLGSLGTYKPKDPSIVHSIEYMVYTILSMVYSIWYRLMRILLSGSTDPGKGDARNHAL